MPLDWEKIRSTGTTTQGSSKSRLNWDEIRNKTTKPDAVSIDENKNQVNNNTANSTKENQSNKMLYQTKAINTIAPTDRKFAQSLPKTVNNNKAKGTGVEELITQPTENIQKNQNKGGFYNKIVEPTNNLISNAVIGGATAIAKPVLKLGGYVNNILRKAQGKEMYSSDEIQSYVDTMANMTQSLVDRKNTLSEVGKTAGNALAYIGSGTALGGGALGYAATSGANAFGNTNDIGDIAVETAIGAAYGAISSVTNKAIVKGIEKIFPATNPLVGETINVGASALKNAVAGAGGTYTATATTGESRNIYNALRGREVTKEEWIRPMWSGETAISTLVGAGLGAYSGTKADISVRAKYEQDVNVLVNKLNLYAKSFNTSIQNGDKQAALDIARVSRDELVKFSMNKYGNRTVEKSVIDNVANKWKNYLEQTTAYYDYKGTSPNVNGQTKVLMSGNNSNQIANNITNNATKVLNPVESGINSTLNVEQIPQNNVQNVSNLQNTIQSDTERFSQEVEEWKNNNWNNKKHLTVLQNTPQLYLDMGLNDLPITVTANKLDRIFNAEGNQKSTYHNLQDLVKELPRAISNPLNIVESSTRDGGIVVVTDLSDSNNDIVVVSLAPDGQGRLEVDDVITTKSANVMTSAYGRRNYDYNVDNQGNYYDGWMEENKKNNRIIYDIDEGIIKKRINGQWLELPNDTDSSNTSVKRLQLPSDTGISDVSSTTNTPINNIIRPGQNYVNNLQENFAFPTNEQLQAMDNKKISTNIDTLNLEKINQLKNKKTSKTYKTNLERKSGLIEQKIKAIEDGKIKRDENAKRVGKEDIRKTIEDSLNRELLTKGFRQRAYGIYKPNTDTIRLAQRSDFETAIHELGHQIDIKQLNNLSNNVDDNVKTELIILCESSFPGAYKKVQTQLEEGFAEATRNFIIDNEKFVKNYPNTAYLIQNELEENPKLNKLFDTLKKQVYDYINMTPKDRVLSNVSFESEERKPKLTKEYIKDKIIELVWDDTIPLKRIVEKVAKSKNVKVDDLSPSENIVMRLKLAQGLEEQTVTSLRNGYKKDGVKKTKGFSEILEGFNHEDIENLVAYMVSDGNLDYIKANKQTGIRENDAKSVINEFKNTKIAKASEEIRKINNYSLRRLQEAGMLTEEQVNSFKQLNEHYVPMNRVIDLDGKIGINTKSLQNGNIIKGRKGSDRMIINPLESTVVNNMRIDRQIANNENLKNFVKVLNDTGLAEEYIDTVAPPMQLKGTATLENFKTVLQGQGVNTDNLDLEAIYNIFTPKLSDDKNMIMSYMENGKRKYIQFKDKTLYNIINGLTQQKGLNIIQKFYSIFNGALRWGATAGNIDFAIPNIIADSQTAFLNSDATFIPIVDSIIGAADTLAGSPNHPKMQKLIRKIAPDYQAQKAMLYELYQKSGAKNTINRSGLRRSNNMENVLGALALDRETLTGKKEAIKPLRTMKEITEWAPDLSEEGTRFRNFEKEMNLYSKKGMNFDDAISKAGYNAVRVTQDFGQSGSITKAINNVIPFTSARLGGTYQAYENFKKNPRRYAIRVAALVAFSVLTKALVNATHKDDKEYEELQDQKRLDNFTFPIGDSKTVTIKKIQGPIRAIINLSEMATDYAMGMIDNVGLEKRFDAIVNDVYMDNSYLGKMTDVAGQFGTPILENALNKDFYYGNALVPDYMKYLDKENQYNENTSETSRLLGKLFKVSPIYIDNLIEGYFAGMGTQALQISDATINFLSGKKMQKPNKQASESFITKRFIADDNKNAQSINEIYEKYDKLKNDEAEGRLTSEQEKQLNNIQQAKETMSIINKQMKETKVDNSLNGKEKAEKLKELQSLRTDTARYYLEKEVTKESNKSQIELLEYYPSSQSKVLNLLDWDEKMQYAQIVKDTYAFNLKELNNDKEYLKANDEEKTSKEKSALSDARDVAKESMIKNKINDYIKEYGENETAQLVLNSSIKKEYEKAKEAGIPLVDFYNAWLAQKNAEGKKNVFGKTVSGTERTAKIKAINEAVDDDLTPRQKKILYGIFNVD